MSDNLTARALSAAGALLQAAAIDDRFAMRRLLKVIHEPGTDDEVGAIVRAVGTAHGVEIGAILSTDRRREVSRARMTVCYIAAELYGHGYAPTGRALGLDHTTVMYAVGRVSGDPNWRAAAKDIAERIGWKAVS